MGNVRQFHNFRLFGSGHWPHPPGRPGPKTAGRQLGMNLSASLAVRCGRARGGLPLRGVRANRPAQHRIGPRHDAQEGRVIAGVKIVG